MSLSNCRGCGKIFSKTDKHMCSDCVKHEEELLLQATEWLHENSGKTINVMSEELGINKRLILNWVRLKRITLTDKDDGVPCKRCGELVYDRILCDRCKIAISHDVQQGLRAIKESAPPPGEEEKKKGMHYIREDRGAKRGNP